MVLQKNQVNEIVIEVSQYGELSSPYYLFHFQSVPAGTDRYCVCTNTSTTLARCDRFSIEDKSNPDNTAGEINLPAGVYHVKVYEQESDSNLDPEQASKLLKEDRWTVEGDTPEVTAYDGAPNNNEAYGG